MAKGEGFENLRDGVEVAGGEGGGEFAEVAVAGRWPGFEGNEEGRHALAGRPMTVMVHGPVEQGVGLGRRRGRRNDAGLGEGIAAGFGDGLGELLVVALGIQAHEGDEAVDGDGHQFGVADLGVEFVPAVHAREDVGGTNLSGRGVKVAFGGFPEPVEHFSAGLGAGGRELGRDMVKND